LEAVLQIVLCYALQELRRYCFHYIHGLEPDNSECRLDFREEKRSRTELGLENTVDVPSLECCMLPNTSSQIARCVLARVRDGEPNIHEYEKIK
jgi:hypothetical protein